MAAGDSARFEAEHQRLLALEHQKLADTAREMHRRFSAAAGSESRLSTTLSVLEGRGYTVLADRRWPKSRRAQVDFIVVGPSGIFIVDAKQWRDVSIAGGHVFRGQEDVTDDFARIADLADSTRTTLAELGLAPGEVHAYAVFTNQRSLKPIDLYGVTLVGEADAITNIVRRGSRLTPAQIGTLIVALNELFPVYGVVDAPQLDLTVLEQPLPASVDQIPIATVEEPALLTVDEIESALVEGMLARPIEEWMAFLHPTQAKLVNRNFSGPSRVRGAAGTGKTVVGLHRAAFLARGTGNRVLVTSFVKTLPAVLGSLLARLAPDAVERVEFTGVYGFATGLLKSRGVNFVLDPMKAGRIFKQLIAQSPLLRIDPSASYWEDEIRAVIKGRGLVHFAEYENLARVGRRRPLNSDQRRLVWDLYHSYSVALRDARICDFADVILLAEASLRNNPLEGYTAVVIDEAQDLTCMMVKMLHHLVGDRPDGLNLIGDGQQTIYAGGFTLAEANVSIAGRGVVMTTNYRNTVEIVEFAASLVQGDQFVDIEGGNGQVDAPAAVIRTGERPTVTRFRSRDEHDRSLVQHVRSVSRGSVGFGDIGVLAMNKWQVSDVRKALSTAGIPTIDLEKYDGRPTNAVKVGTIHRAKGLEFKQVVVARTSPQLLDAAISSLDDSGRERRDLDRRALYVAMTRARDGLWVGVA